MKGWPGEEKDIWVMGVQVRAKVSDYLLGERNAINCNLPRLWSDFYSVLMRRAFVNTFVRLSDVGDTHWD